METNEPIQKPTGDSTNKPIGESTRGPTGRLIKETVKASANNKSLLRSIFWWFMTIFCVFWIFYPEPTDLIPILGWLDEGLAGVLLITALSKLGISIPFLDQFMAWRKGKGSTDKK